MFIGAQPRPEGEGTPQPPSRRRRVARVATIAAGVLVALGTAWILITGIMARHRLESVRAELHQLRARIAAGDGAGARRVAAQISRTARDARDLTTGPAWALASDLPWVGDPLDTVRGIATVAADLGTNVLPEVVTATETLDPTTLRAADGRIDLARVAAMAPIVDHVSGAVDDAERRLRGLPSDTWLSSADSGRNDAVRVVGDLSSAVHDAAVGAHVIPAMLGQDGPKTYFVAFQNEAEARGTGGIPGAFAILTADHGLVHFTGFYNDSTLVSTTSGIDLGQDYRQLYGTAGTSYYANGNLSPNFPYAARIWSAMWQRHSGKRVDGVIALDAFALRYLLHVSGSAEMANGDRVTSDNVVPLTMSWVYIKYPKITDVFARRRYLLDVAKAAATAVLEPRTDTIGLLKAAAKAAGERRLLVWSADPSFEQQLGTTPVGGVVPESNAPYIGLSIYNNAGNKLDYYLDRTLSWVRKGCDASRTVTVTITLHNSALGSGLPQYVTTRYDAHSYPVQPGDNRLAVGYFATAGAHLRHVLVDGKQATASVGTERGHPVFTVDLELPHSSTRTIVLTLVEPKGKGAPIVLRQPLARPIAISIKDAQC